MVTGKVHKRLVSAKKPNTIVPGDVPVKLVKEFTPELAKPATLIFNTITSTCEYPRQWVIEHQLAIPKVYPPQSVDDLRNISSTSFLSKVFESFIGEWLFPYIEPYLDPGQCGGLKGSSISHYLVKLLHFIHSYLDKNDPYAVLLVMVDLEKAFNRVSHQLVIEDLAAMHVPRWLLLILISYLTDRSMFMRYRDAVSSIRALPGSSPQGTFLGVLLFIIVFNGALLRPSVPRPDSLNLKYIDDLSLLQAIKLRDALVNDNTVRQFPLTKAESHGLMLPANNNPLQKSLSELKTFTDKKFMKIKESKTKIMKFSFSHQYDFPTEVQVEGFSSQLEEIQQTKLLGVMISSDLKWSGNTEYICKKAYKRIWILRRLRTLGVSPSFILDVYIKEIRSVLELAVPAWHSGLTRKQSVLIERVQKVRIILGDFSIGYRAALSTLGLESLETRRVKFAKLL